MDAEAILNSRLENMAAAIGETKIDNIQWKAGEAEEWLRQINEDGFTLSTDYLSDGTLTLALT